jgi:ATP-dependent protease HslVU (ClpYQ) peptidase subunit
MTCIVGIAYDGEVFMGADSAGVNGYDRMLRGDPKLYRNGEFIIGFTSSFRMGQLLGMKFEPPVMAPQTDVFRYMVTEFVESARSCLSSGGFAKKDNNVESGGDFLVGVRGRLFRIESDFQVAERLDGFDAIGCGAFYALGSLAETADLKPADRISHALSAAARFSVGVNSPFQFERLRGS